MINIRIATTDTEIAACHPAMRELRPHISQDEFVPRIRSQEQSGYRLAFAEDASKVVAVAGFRLARNLAWGRFLYVDDLVTLATQRSKGYGSRLLDWLKEYAAAAGCGQLHLDSGTHREQAHRFYQRAGMALAGYHFFIEIEPR